MSEKLSSIESNMNLDVPLLNECPSNFDFKSKATSELCHSDRRKLSFKSKAAESYSSSRKKSSFRSKPMAQSCLVDNSKITVVASYSVKSKAAADPCYFDLKKEKKSNIYFTSQKL